MIYYLIGVILLFFLISKIKKPISLDGSNILLTGGAQGIGYELTKILMSQCKNIRLHVVDVNTKTEIKNYQQKENNYNNNKNVLNVYEIDIRDKEKIKDLVDRIGKVDVLINNAGVFRKGQIIEKNMEQIEMTFDVNLIAAIHLIKLVIGKMVEDNKGVIVNICSLTKDIGGLEMADYCSSKAALYMFHRVLRFGKQLLTSNQHIIIILYQLKSKKSGIHTIIVSPYVLDGGMFDGFRIPLLSSIFPALKHSKVALLIFNSIIYKQEEIFIPRYMSVIAIVLNIIPHKILDFLSLLFLRNACSNIYHKKEQ